MILRISLGAALFSASLVASVSAQPDTTPATIANPLTSVPGVQAPPAPRPGTPAEQIESDLKGLLEVLNSEEVAAPSDGFAIPTSISGSRIGYFGLDEWIDYFVRQRGETRYRFDKVEVQSMVKDAARVKVFYALLTPNNLAPVDGQPAKPEIFVTDQSEILDLKREIVPWFGNRERWRIVPPIAENLQGHQPLSLQSIAYYGSQRAGLLPQLRAEISAARLKQCGQCTRQFLQDYDEQFGFGPEFWRDALRPYVRNDSVYLIPGTQTPFTFNANLSDHNTNQIAKRGQMVLFYEGEDEKPVFRYAGKAAICFVDGHVALVSPDEAKSLIWKP